MAGWRARRRLRRVELRRAGPAHPGIRRRISFLARTLHLAWATSPLDFAAGGFSAPPQPQPTVSANTQTLAARLAAPGKRLGVASFCALYPYVRRRRTHGHPKVALIAGFGLGISRLPPPTPVVALVSPPDVCRSLVWISSATGWNAAGVSRRESATPNATCRARFCWHRPGDGALSRAQRRILFSTTWRNFPATRNRPHRRARARRSRLGQRARLIALAPATTVSTVRHGRAARRLHAWRRMVVCRAGCRGQRPPRRRLSNARLAGHALERDATACSLHRVHTQPEHSGHAVGLMVLRRREGQHPAAPIGRGCGAVRTGRL